MVPGREDIWDGASKIPWDDPDFSRRMLREHLSQAHDMASRRAEWIDRQVAWIHHEPLSGKPSRVLDLGCGPGLYAHRLAARGHCVHGIDFGPASIDYALEHAPAGERCTFALGDVREADLAGPYDLAMMVFGEFNTFAPDDARAILAKARASLEPGGVLLVETQTPAAVEQVGKASASEQRLDAGLFSDDPHVWRTENRWLEEEGVAIQTFTVTDAATGAISTYRSTAKAWSDAELVTMLTEAGFTDAAPVADWPSNIDALRLWRATAG